MWWAVAGLLAGGLFSQAARAQRTLVFDFSGPGELKAMTEWGADTSWPSEDNMRQCVTHMGADEIDVVRINFFTDEPLQANGDIGPNSRTRIDRQLALAAMAGDKPIALSPSTEAGTHASYLGADNRVVPSRWLALMEATQRYIGRPIVAIEPFNEPDWTWGPQGTAQTLNDILVLLQSSPNFQGTELHGASTLSSDLAQTWYYAVAGPVTHGTTHQLGGSASSYVNFIRHVRENGDIAYNPELHSMAEVLMGCEYGLSGGIWWAEAQLSRGVLVHAVQGRRLGYAEDLATSSSGAVYRAPDGRVYGFAGSFERFGPRTNYRFVSSNQDLFFNGIGPIREFMYFAEADQQGGFFPIETSPSLPVLDGYRWKLVNRANGKVLEVVGASLSDGASLRTAADVDGPHQKWDIVRGRDGYFTLINANSGKVADDYDWSVVDGGRVAQWARLEGLNQKWYVEQGDAGYLVIRNGHSTKVMTTDVATDNVIQWAPTGGQEQQWQLVAAEPVRSGTPTVRFELDGNLSDSAGANVVSTNGAPTYVAGVGGQALDLDGVDDYVVLPNDIARSVDLTIAAWVRWDGGSARQAVFDFGVNTGKFLSFTPSNTQGMMDFSIRTNTGRVQSLLTDSLPVGTWQHVAITLRGNTGILYVNGRARVAGFIALNATDILDATPQFNRIGKSQVASDPLFDGQVDDFRIYDYALGATEVAGLVAGVIVPPEIVAAPVSQAIMTGAAVTLSVQADGASDLAYQWQHDGVDIPGATGSSFSIPSVQAFHAGSYSVVVSDAWGSTASVPASLLVESPPPSDARLMNLSTRALCQTGDDVLIPGFVIQGTGTKRLLMRAVGPELESFKVAGVLPDPQMVLKRQSDGVTLASSDDWGTNANSADIVTSAASVWAFPLVQGSRSAALLMDLPAGAYTIVSSGKGSDTGVSIVELYEIEGDADDSRLVNISNRGYVGVGGDIMIPGFVVSNEGPRTFLVRAVGPTLAGFGVSGTLSDPILRIFRGSENILTNDNWGENGDADHVRAMSTLAKAFGLKQGSKDASFVVTLQPGAYTVQASGVDGATGAALVEIYLIQN